MPKTDKRVDAYVANAKDFARPILERLRAIVHEGCPELPKAKQEPAMPEVFMSAIKKNEKAEAAFEKFSPSHKREYIEWITDAKAEATRDRRIAQAVEWMAEGKPRNWKYM